MSNLLPPAALDAALTDPYGTLHRLFDDANLGKYFEDVMNGRSAFHLVGREEGDAPAGFISRVDVIDTVPGQRGLTVDGQNINEIWAEMQAMLAAFNASADALTAYLTFPVVAPNFKVGVPTNPGFQKATEYGRPSKIRMSQVSRGFPLVHFDLGDGYTQEYIDSATGAQILAVQATVISSWAQLRREVTLEALMLKTNYTDQDAIAVKRLYNADGEVPPTIKRWSHAGTHTHYLYSAGTSWAQADVDTMSTHLIHHGFREFGDSTFLLHAHRDDVADVRGFADFIPAESGERPIEFGSTGVVAGQQRSAGTGGLRVEGWVNDWTVVQNNDIPTGYFLGTVSGGPFDVRNVVGLRVHENPSVRGLRLIEGNRQNYPLYDSVYDGYIGAGVAQRGAAVAMYEDTGAGSAYTDPTVFQTGE